MIRKLSPGDPSVIGRYRLVGQLGSGGMGRVFLGISPGGRPVAIKVIRADLAADPHFRTRFQREVAAARLVSGLYTAAVVNADTEADAPWLATAYVAGPSLAEAVHEQGPLPAESVITLAAALAESLTAIHAAGVVHRDLKPSNVLLAEDGPRVIDFGISRASQASSLTHTGFVVGSPGFMSPEQARGQAVGPPSDIFCLGSVLAFAATGESPFGSGESAALVYRVVHEPPRLDGVPGQIRALVEECLAKEPGQRPDAAGVLSRAGDVQPMTGWLPTLVLRPGQAKPDLAEDQPAATTGPGRGNTGAGGGTTDTQLPEAGPQPMRRSMPQPVQRSASQHRLATAGLRRWLDARHRLSIAAAAVLAVAASLGSWLSLSAGTSHRTSTQQHGSQTAQALEGPATAGPLVSMTASASASRPATTTGTRPATRPPRTRAVTVTVTTTQPVTVTSTHTTAPRPRPSPRRTTASPTTFSVSLVGATEDACGARVSSPIGEGFNFQFLIIDKSPAVLQVDWINTVGGISFQGDIKPGGSLTVGGSTGEYYEIQDPRGCLGILDINSEGQATIS